MRNLSAAKPDLFCCCSSRAINRFKRWEMNCKCSYLGGFCCACPETPSHGRLNLTSEFRNQIRCQNPFKINAQTSIGKNRGNITSHIFGKWKNIEIHYKNNLFCRFRRCVRERKRYQQIINNDSKI